jgi:hypothetical protein
MQLLQNAIEINPLVDRKDFSRVNTFSRSALDRYAQFSPAHIVRVRIEHFTNGLARQPADPARASSLSPSRLREKSASFCAQSLRSSR